MPKCGSGIANVCAAGSGTKLIVPPGLAQALQHMVIVFLPMPGHPRTHKQVESLGRNRHGLRERLPRLIKTPELTKRCRQPTIGQWEVGIPSKQTTRGFDSTTVVPLIVVRDHDLIPPRRA